LEVTGPIGRNREKGRRGEAAALRFLERQGFKVVEQNVFYRQGEIDLVAESPDHRLVFIEVKSALSHQAGEPALKVDKKKQSRIGRAAEIYLAQKGWTDRPCRFDVLSIRFENGRAPDVTHYENAFMMG